MNIIDASVGVPSLLPMIPYSPGDDKAALRSTNSPRLQAMVNYVAAGGKNGKIIVPEGYWQVVGIVMPSGVTIEGLGQECSHIGQSDVNLPIFTFAEQTKYGGLRDLDVAGFQSPSATDHAIRVHLGAAPILRDLRVFGGSYALYTRGTDGYYENLYLNGFGINGGAVFSHGSNWYVRCKMDCYPHQVVCAFAQSSPYSTDVHENHFTQCDFSGNHPASVDINDHSTNTAITVFEGCIFSNPLNIVSARATILSGCELGAGITHNSGALIVSGCYGLGAVGVSGGGAPRSGAANINVSI